MSADGPAGPGPEPVQDSALPLRREVTALPDGRRITFYSLEEAGGAGDETGEA